MWWVSDRLTVSSWDDGAHILSPTPQSFPESLSLICWLWRDLSSDRGSVNPGDPLWGMHSWLRVDGILQWHHCSIRISKTRERSVSQKGICNYHYLHSYSKWSWMQPGSPSEDGLLTCGRSQLSLCFGNQKPVWMVKLLLKSLKLLLNDLHTYLHTPGTSAGQM